MRRYGQGMSQHVNGIDLDDLRSFWAKRFWAAHVKRSDRISIMWSATHQRVVFQHGTQARMSRAIVVPDKELDVLTDASMLVFEDKDCYLALRSVGSWRGIVGTLKCRKCRSDGETGYRLYGMTFDLSRLWGWMDQVRAVREAIDLDANTAPALKQCASRHGRL